MAKSICRICLAENIRMHSIVNTELQLVYEKLTTLPFVRTTSRPLLVCYICYQRLDNCRKLMHKCYQADALFTKLLDCKLDPERYDELSNFNHLTSISVLKFDIGSNSSKIKVKNIVKVDFDSINNELEVKTETDEIGELPQDHSTVIVEQLEEQLVKYEEFVDNLTDSEDDVPLTELQSEDMAKKKVGKRKKYKLKREIKPKKENIDLDCSEISLTKQEQLEDLLARTKSLNYIRSPFKCEQCYKGFVDKRAFDNHNITHDESSGAYVCEICRMRYSCALHLRRHALAAHARRYRCNTCAHDSQTRNQALIHAQWHNGHTYECKLCSQKFKKPTTYLSHLRTRHSSTHWCTLCGEGFAAPRGLQLHRAKAHRTQTESQSITIPEAYCGQCDVQFVSVAAWQRHVLTSTKHARDIYESQCKICNWRATDTASLATHIKEHKKLLRRGTKPATHNTRVNCDMCNKQFVSKYKLQVHVDRVHLGVKYNKNIVCEVCGKKCTSNATLRYHQRTHTGEKPYSCVTCRKQFADSNRLRIHTRTHTGDKPYVCAACGKRFTQKPALNRHARVHTGAKPYTCQYCSRTFTQSNSLKGHVNTVHLKLPAKQRRRKNDGTRHENDEKPVLTLPHVSNVTVTAK